MTTVIVWIEIVDYSTAIGDNDPTITCGKTKQFNHPAWEEALAMSYDWIRANRQSNWIVHVEFD